MWVLITLVVLCSAAKANYPSFEASHRMRVLLVPADMRVGSVIYRLRATDPDYDYPLRFDVVGKRNTPCLLRLADNKKKLTCSDDVFSR